MSARGDDAEDEVLRLFGKAFEGGVDVARAAFLAALDKRERKQQPDAEAVTAWPRGVKAAAGTGQTADGSTRRGFGSETGTSARPVVNGPTVKKAPRAL
jgi:hypothetical protein